MSARKGSSFNNSGRKEASLFHRAMHRLHYTMYALLLLGLLWLFLVDGKRLLGLGLIVLALIGFVVSAKLRDMSALEDDFEADENGNAKPNYR